MTSAYEEDKGGHLIMDYVHFDTDDLKKNNIAAALGCLVFPVPLIVCSQSRFGRFCANQGLVLCIAQLVLKIAFYLIDVLLGWIPLIGPILNIVGMLARLAVAIYAFYLAYKAYNCAPEQMIGNIHILDR